VPIYAVVSDDDSMPASVEFALAMSTMNDELLVVLSHLNTRANQGEAVWV
jgi:hypothetical protein